MKSTICSFFFLLFVLDIVHCYSVTSDKANLPGIWRLECNCLPYEPDIRSKLYGLISKDDPSVTVPDGTLIKINPDGTFKQCNEGYKEGRWISGKWEMGGKNNKEVFLAFRRQYYGPAVDILLQVNKLRQQECDDRLQMLGQVVEGKFALPQNHPDFFQQLIPDGCALGSFTMEQILSTKSLISTTSSHDDGDDLELYF